MKKKSQMCDRRRLTIEPLERRELLSAATANFSNALQTIWNKANAVYGPAVNASAVAGSTNAQATSGSVGALAAVGASSVASPAVVAASDVTPAASSLSTWSQPLPTMPPTSYGQSGLYPAGTVTTVTYYSTSMAANDTMLVYTPPSYSSSQKYPVIYTYQGIGASASYTFASWCVNANIIADNLIGQGKIHPVIIVAVDDNGTNENTQTDTLNTVIPYIDSHYSTYADADHRGLYGYSWGGMYTLTIGGSNLNTFHYLSPSSAAVFNTGQGPTYFPNGGAQAKQVIKTLLLSCGTSDWDGFYPNDLDLANYCTTNGIPHAWWPVNGAGHDASVWAPAMWNFLQMADAAGIANPPVPHTAFTQVEAENYATQSGGVAAETCSDTGGGQDVGTIQNGSYISFNSVDFGTGAVSFNARVASANSGGNIELRLDSATGTLLGTCAVSGTGGWQTWTTQSCTVSGATGIHNLYLVFTGGSGNLFNINWWKFSTSSLPTVPSAPSGLTATAGIEKTGLSWTASSNTASYNVKRATTSGGPYTTLANVAGTSYTDTTALGGTTYYYVVSALNDGGESVNSSEANATPTVNAPSPWLARDVGTPGLPGGESFSNGAFTVIGSGADIWDTSDAFRFVYLPATGDCTIVARVTSLPSYINSWSKAGVMIRSSLDANAANALIAMTSSNGATWQYRSSAGGSTTNNSATGPSAPYWVKLVRSGSTFTGYYSSNGTTWTQLGSTSITMASTVYVGLAVTCHLDYTLCSATFDNVTAPGWAHSPAATPTTLAATPGVERASLSWAASSNADSYNIKRATTSGGPYTTIATVTTTSYTDTRLVGGTNYYYVISATNNYEGESNNSTQVKVTPTSNVPAPWVTQDIGTTGVWGSASQTGSTFTLAASGDDIWNSADAFRFVYTTTTSDFTFVARVASLQNVNSWSKAGIMIRDSLDPGAADVFMAVTPGNGATFQYRTTDAGSTSNATASGISAPYWVKLVKSGTTFTGYSSSDGKTWTQVGSATLSTVSTAYVGLAVTSHNNSSLCTATFDNVSPPTVATAAAASPSSVTGTTANLSVLGADLTGEANLNYTWSMASGPATVTFSANGTNAAKATTATFTKAGSYTFLATITNVGGTSTTSSVNVTVAQTPASITVSPATASVLSGKTRQFSATAFDQFGVSMTTQPAFTWSVVSGGGSIDSNGLFTAPYAAGSVTVKATSGSASKTFTVTVTNAAPTVVAAAAATPIPLGGTTTTLSVLGGDDAGEALLSYTWAMTSGPAAVTFAANGTNAAKNTLATFTQAGYYTFAVTIADLGGLTATSSVGVYVNQVLSSLSVSPASSAAGGITMNGGSSGATVSALAGNDTISAALHLASDTAIDAIAASTLTVTGPIDGDAALTKTGGGRLVLAAANTFAGGLAVQSGSVLVSAVNDLLDGSNLTIGAGDAFNSTSIKTAAVALADSSAADSAAIVSAPASTVAKSLSPRAVAAIMAANPYFHA